MTDTTDTRLSQTAPDRTHDSRLGRALVTAGVWLWTRRTGKESRPED